MILGHRKLVDALITDQLSYFSTSVLLLRSNSTMNKKHVIHKE